MDKQAFQLKDRLIKGITGDGHFKISVVKTSDVVRTAREKHQLSLLSTVILGRALTATIISPSRRSRRRLRASA